MQTKDHAQKRPGVGPGRLHSQGNAEQQLEGDKSAAHIGRRVLQVIGLQNVVRSVGAKRQETTDGDRDIQSSLQPCGAHQYFVHALRCRIGKLCVAAEYIHVDHVSTETEAEALGYCPRVRYPPPPSMHEDVAAEVVRRSQDHHHGKADDPRDRNEREVAQIREVAEERHREDHDTRRNRDDNGAIAAQRRHACHLHQFLDELGRKHHVPTTKTEGGHHQHCSERNGKTLREEHEQCVHVGVCTSCTHAGATYPQGSVAYRATRSQQHGRAQGPDLCNRVRKQEYTHANR
mmetsp:Transcript_44915/g.103805  ORF Transcript_44915/g.103805 Transcript_44915/m.103805 type:complete len:290 (+) Transcript_44915:783-1652(+)